MNGNEQYARLWMSHRRAVWVGGREYLFQGVEIFGDRIELCRFAFERPGDACDLRGQAFVLFLFDGFSDIR